MKTLLLCTLLVFGLGGCKKADEPEVDYIRGHINGKPYECIVDITANGPESSPHGGDDPHLRITGAWASYWMKLMLLDEGTIQARTYSFDSGTHRTLTLFQHNVNLYFAGYNSSPFLPEVVGSGSVTITTVTNKHVQGSFNCVAMRDTAKINLDGIFSIHRND